MGTGRGTGLTVKSGDNREPRMEFRVMVIPTVHRELFTDLAMVEPKNRADRLRSLAMIGLAQIINSGLGPSQELIRELFPRGWNVDPKARQRLASISAALAAGGELGDDLQSRSGSAKDEGREGTKDRAKDEGERRQAKMKGAKLGF